MVLGDYYEESRKVDFDKLPALGGEIIYGSYIHNYVINGEEFDIGKDTYLTFEPSASKSVMMIRDQ
jgi:hypothetical protein